VFYKGDLTAGDALVFVGKMPVANDVQPYHLVIYLAGYTNKEQSTNSDLSRAESRELQTNNYTATLPNGVTVELLGVCEVPENTATEDKQYTNWWKPDGSPLEKRPFKRSTFSSRKMYDDRKWYCFAFSSYGKNKYGGTLRRISVKESSGGGSGMMIDEYDEYLYSKALGHELSLLPSALDTTEIEFGFQGGPWNMLAKATDKPTEVTFEGKYLKITPAQIENGKLFIHTYEAFRHDVKDKHIGFGLIIEEDGKEIIKPLDAFPSDVTDDDEKDIRQEVYEINLPWRGIITSENIKGTCIRYFPFEKVTFKDVALRPKEVDKELGQGSNEQVPDLSQINSSITVSRVNKTEGETQSSVSGPQSSAKKIDLVPADLKLHYDSKRKTYSLVVFIENQTNTVLPKHRIRYYRGDPADGLDETGNPHSGWHEAGPIEPGKTWNERTRSFFLPDGDYTFTVVLDYNNTIAEADENNNQTTLNVTIQDGQIIKKSSKKSFLDEILLIPDKAGAMVRFMTMSEKELVKGLSFFAGINDGKYPSTMADYKTIHTEMFNQLKEKEKNGDYADITKAQKKELEKGALDTFFMKAYYDKLVNTGKEPAYFGPAVTADDKDKILLRWKKTDKKIRVMYGDLRIETIEKMS
jgi:hypothetical protein